MALSERDHETIFTPPDGSPALRMCDLSLLALIARKARGDWFELNVTELHEVWGMLARLSANGLVEVSVDRVLTVKARVTDKAQGFVAGVLDATPGDPANGLVLA